MKIVKRYCHLLASMKLVHIDRNMLYKERQFEIKQSEHRNKTKKLCTTYHQKIKEEIEILSQQFCNGTQDVLTAWTYHITSIDNQILEALLQSVKISLHAFSTAVNGYGLAGESHPLFAVTVILKNGSIECRPSMIEITNSVNIVAKELIGVTKSIDRMSSHTQKNDQSIRLGGTFYEEISSDQSILDIVVQIMKGAASCISSAGEKLLEWESYRSLWDMDKDSFLRRYSKTKQKSFERDINHYQNLGVSIKKERPSVLIDFIQLNFSTLKLTLVSHSEEFQEKLLDLLEEKTIKKLHSIHNFFDTNIHKLRRPVQSIGALCEITELLSEVERECGDVNSDVDPLEKAFKILSKYEKERINSKHEEKLKELKPRQKQLCEEILNAKMKTEKSKIIIKGEFQTIVSNHKDQMLKICSKLEEAFSSKSTATSKDANTWIQTVTDNIKSHREKETNLQQGIDFFGMDLPDSQRLENAEKNLHLMQNVLEKSKSWLSTWDRWLGTAISRLDAQDMEEICNKFIKELLKMHRDIRNWQVWKDFRAKLEDFKCLLPLVQDLMSEGMCKRHWDTIGEAICRDFSFSQESFTLNDVLLLGLQRHTELISDLAAQASRELTVERTLKDMKERLLCADINFMPYKDTHNIAATDELFSTIEDDMVSLQSMKSSNNAKAFLKQIDTHEKDLNRVIEFIESFTAMQRQWLYLENIFVASGGDIRHQLPGEYQTFLALNKQFKEMMKQLFEIKKVSSICKHDCTTAVEVMILKMEEIQKSLDNYLEMKRKLFPRFYFISDDDLLELIGKSKEPDHVQKHMKKCFEGAALLLLNSKNDDNDFHFVTGVKASDGERLDFVKQVPIEGSIELWLESILRAVQLGLKNSLDGCTKSLKSSKKESWVREWQGQVLITAGAISWTRGCEKALEAIKTGKDKHSLRVYRKKQISLLRRLTEMVRDPSQLRINRSKIVALITMEVHNRDVIEKLIRNGCQDPNDFTWMSQLRFNMEQGDDGFSTCNVKQTYCQLPYGYEYQGNNGRLVVTPLTDRCILTLITAKFLHRGGNPLGPAGTGKTETVKDLAKNLAYFCVVSNCSETMDFKSVGRIFSGLCQSGAWGCFDEFNRIKVEVISVVAMQISSIFNALRCNQSVFNFMGSNIKCSPDTGIFITMNPGYAGRSELPDNLKALMRPVAMMSPDLVLISEVVLSAEGFADSRELAKKIITLYKLMQEQLSKQSHYDYGLRSIKGVLTMAGSMKQSEKDVEEELVVILAIKCLNEPKFVKDDLKLFDLLLCDLFPKRSADNRHSEQLQTAIEQALTKENLQCAKYTIEKTLQLAHSMKVRHCNMIIGETFTGKTSIWQTLSSAKQLVSPENHEYSPSISKFMINPKALTIEELYGSYDTVTFEWKDGVISNIFKTCSESPKHEVQKWIVFDGPVDALWIESMNSVMDDNKVLTLVNGDRISLTSSMALLFEVENLSVASPATVSRAGMIYIGEDLGWKPFLQTWVHKNANMFKEHKSFFNELCEKVRYHIMYYFFVYQCFILKCFLLPVVSCTST